jgi:DNA-binding response OmpR family regulator
MNLGQTTDPSRAARVLVVDDELHVRSALAHSLRIVGYEAEEAESGEQALEMLSRTAYDVMVLDLRMPGMQGIEVMERTHQIHPDLLVIVLTGNASLESAITAVKCGAVDYLLKPTSVHDVASAVTRALKDHTETLRRELIQTMNRALDSLSQGQSPGQSHQPAPHERFLKAGLVTLDQARNIVVINTTIPHTAELTETEAAVLSYLMERPEEAVSCYEIAHSALSYGVDKLEAQSIIRPHISRLRQKLDTGAEKLDLIRTVRGKGYFFSPGEGK